MLIKFLRNKNNINNNISSIVFLQLCRGFAKPVEKPAKVYITNIIIKIYLHLLNIIIIY